MSFQSLLTHPQGCKLQHWGCWNGFCERLHSLLGKIGTVEDLASWTALKVLQVEQGAKQVSEQSRRPWS